MFRNRILAAALVAVVFSAATNVVNAGEVLKSNHGLSIAATPQLAYEGAVDAYFLQMAMTWDDLETEWDNVDLIDFDVIFSPAVQLPSGSWEVQFAGWMLFDCYNNGGPGGGPGPPVVVGF